MAAKVRLYQVRPTPRATLTLESRVLKEYNEWRPAPAGKDKHSREFRTCGHSRAQHTDLQLLLLPATHFLPDRRYICLYTR